jgi:hypothetical protein
MLTKNAILSAVNNESPQVVYKLLKLMHCEARCNGQVTTTETYVY